MGNVWALIGMRLICLLLLGSCPENTFEMFGNLTRCLKITIQRMLSTLFKKVKMTSNHSMTAGLQW